MRTVLVQRVLPISLLLSLILHISFLCMIAIMPLLQEKKEKLPDIYQSAYLYQSNVSSVMQSQSKRYVMPETTTTMQAATVEPVVHHGTIASHQPINKRSSHVQNKKKQVPYVMSMTYQFLRQNYQENSRSIEKEEEPIYLIGDLNSPVNPLIKLLGHALSKHFNYPHVAGMLRIKGRALVSLVLHPTGELSHIQLLQSTENQELDAAALYAANHAPIVKGASKFLSKPKRFVIGFIFR